MEIVFLKSVTYLREYTLKVEFNDGLIGEIDLSVFFDKRPYERLKDLELFKKFQLNEWTIFWGEIDIAPETLYDEFIKQNMYISAFPNE